MCAFLVSLPQKVCGRTGEDSEKVNKDDQQRKAGKQPIKLGLFRKGKIHTYIQKKIIK